MMSWRSALIFLLLGALVRAEWLLHSAGSRPALEEEARVGEGVVVAAPSPIALSCPEGSRADR